MKETQVPTTSKTTCLGGIFGWGRSGSAVEFGSFLGCW